MLLCLEEEKRGVAMDDRGRGVIVRKSGGGALILFRRIEEGRYSFIPQQASVVTVACTQRDGEKASAAYSAGGNHKVRCQVVSFAHTRCFE